MRLSFWHGRRFQAGLVARVPGGFEANLEKFQHRLVPRVLRECSKGSSGWVEGGSRRK